jgi:hypothetical protein
MSERLRDMATFRTNRGIAFGLAVIAVWVLVGWLGGAQ